MQPIQMDFPLMYAYNPKVELGVYKLYFDLVFTSFIF